VSAYLVVLGHGNAIRWVLTQQRMAFPATPRAEVRELAAGDQLFLYATRGAWGNPGRDRGRVIGMATATTSVLALDQPVEIAGRTFASGCDLTIEGVVPFPGGVELQPLVDQLGAFPKPEAWSAYMRRPLLRLPSADAAVLRRRLRSLMAEGDASIKSYAQTVAPSAWARRRQPARPTIHQISSNRRNLGRHG